MRVLTTHTRLKIEAIISKLINGNHVTLQERIDLHKYARKIPFIGIKLKHALKVSQSMMDQE